LIEEEKVNGRNCLCFLADGQWIVRVSAEAGLARRWLDIRRIDVRNGAMQ
jgi:nitrogen fixation protein FixH